MISRLLVNIFSSFFCGLLFSCRLVKKLEGKLRRVADDPAKLDGKLRGVADTPLYTNNSSSNNNNNIKAFPLI